MIHRGIMAHLKRTGREEQWIHYMVGGGYEECETIGDYCVEYDDKDEYSRRFLILNPTEPCLVIAIDKKYDKTASMDSVKFNPKCTIDGKMKRGDGTRKMIQFGIDLARKEGASQVSIMDNSTIDCEGQKIDLPGMYFLKYGMTWYEKYFGFKPAERFQKSYAKAKDMREKLLDVKKLQEEKCDFFTDDTIQELLAIIRFTNFYKFEWILKL